MADLVLLPGFMCDEDMWADAVPWFDPSINLHFPGFGPGATLAEMADHVAASGPDRFYLLGFSMGGYVAREIALRHPARVQGVILTATSARADSSERHRLKQDLADLTERSGFRGISRASISDALHPDHPSRQQFADRIREMGRRLGGEIFVRQLRLERQDGLPALTGIGCPALVIAAESDRLRPVAESREMTSVLPDARLEIIGNCGHMIPMEQPEKFATLAGDWLLGQEQGNRK